MSDEPLVSVLMAVYNEQPYLARAVKSVLGQSFQDFELIIVDDASTDDTPNIINELKDERTVVLRNEKNVGKAACLNRALGVAQGKYLFELDGDDWLDRDALKQLIAAREKLPANTGLMIASVQEYRQRRTTAEFRRIRPAPEQIDRNSLLLGSHKMGCRLWLTEAVRTVGGWKIDQWTQGRAFENWVLAVEVSKQYSVASVDLAVYNARRHRRNMADRLKHHWLEVRNWVLGDNLAKLEGTGEEVDVENDDKDDKDDKGREEVSTPRAVISPWDDVEGEDEMEEEYPGRYEISRAKPVFYPQDLRGEPVIPREPRQSPTPVRFQAGFFGTQADRKVRDLVALSTKSPLSEMLVNLAAWQSPDAWRNPRVESALVPVGILQFGRGHLPVASAVLRAMAFSYAAARRVRGLVLPPIVAGAESTQNWGFFKPVEVDQDVLRNSARQALQTVSRSGVPRVVFVVTPSDRVLLESVENALREQALYRGRIWIFNEQDIMRKLNYRSHLGDWEASVLLALDEELVGEVTSEQDASSGSYAASPEKGLEIVDEVAKYFAQRMPPSNTR